MSDSYQAVYDAVRSRIRSCDAGEIVRDAVRGLDGSHAIHMIQQEFAIAAGELARPSAVYRATLRCLGADHWAAFYGDVLLGQGTTPANAMAAFDRAWHGQQA